MVPPYVIQVDNPKRRDAGIDGRIILNWILGKYDARVRTGFNWIRILSTGGIL
jgi:hypothetical protein